MKNIFIITLLAALFQSNLIASAIDPKNVAIIYNSRTAASKELALYYATARSIPQENLIGLDVEDKDEISRKEYNSQIQEPLRKIFTTRGWWTMSRNAQNVELPSASKITTLVCMRGIPFKIQRGPITEKNPPKLPAHFSKVNEASVDSELAFLGVHGISTLGPQTNPYFKKDVAFSKAGISYMLMVGRIDGPDYAISKRLIDDAIATEKRGLWGMCYLDKALKGGGYAVGDNWMETIFSTNLKQGIPTVIDRNKQTLTSHYPMNDAAIYYGWYTRNQNGPLLNPTFKFRQGAVAVHLHSYSASQLRNPKKEWTGPILAKGAAATVGNVYEPYLQLTHHFDVLHDRLLKGYTLVEAAYMSAQALSWQNVVVGDPLYRPFLHFNGSGEKHPEDKTYRAIRIANQEWGDDPETLVKKLRTAAAGKSNPKLYEYLGLWHWAQNKPRIAIAFFQTAVKKHLRESDQLRQWLYVADIHRHSGDKLLAIQTLQKAHDAHGKIPEIKSATALLNILSPPPPPPAAEAKKRSDAKKLKKK
ncbi:MAG: TIGR03790 family protein [Akkermansiaceae bacterium]